MNERLWNILLDALPKLLRYGVEVTLPLTAISFLLALLIAVIVALIQYAQVKGLKQLCRFYVWIVRGTPLLVQLYLVFYGLPSVGVVIDAFPAAVLVFGFNEGAYMAETMRGALESVSRGQMEAGYCVGMSYLQIMGHVVLPQAFRTAFPALSNSLISMLKGTSMASTITVMEMFRQAQVINGRVYESLGLYGEVALIYLLFCTLLSWFQRLGERRLASYGGAVK
ncbi:MAG: amino acid ABC transporter permease [Clostridia bacterium]|nr:amino acid ABC transporter permease [Clostridia bacterium]